MDESFKSKRVIFIKGRQREFITQARNELKLTSSALAELVGISARNVTDWKNEKISMPFEAVRIICKKRKISLPKYIEIKDRYWYVTKGAKKGGLAVYKKYGTIGSPKKRKEKWRKWWEEKGKYIHHKILEPLPFKKPRYSKKLAEFVGIVLGDGGMTNYQVKITLHRIDDLQYSIFVEKLAFSLFKIKPKKIPRSDCMVFNIVISRTGIVKFCIEKLGLKKGNKIKQQIDVPEWIKKKKSYRIACLRGLVDTDGCIIIHKYKSKGKYYIYKKLSFTSRSNPLLKSVSEILFELGIKNRFTNHYEVRVEAKKDIKQYFELVGTHNKKHLDRYKK